MGSSFPFHAPMPHDNMIPQGRQLAAAGLRSVPTLFLDAGEKAWWRFVEFFTAHIRNRNTREAYARAVAQFSAWCGAQGVILTDLKPYMIASYIEELGQRAARPTVK